MAKKTPAIKDIPHVDRPREKIMRYGPDKLSNTELLAILLRTGQQGENVLALSHRVLKQFHSGNLAKASIKQLTDIHGIGPATACQLVATFELGKRLLKGKTARLYLSPEDVWKATQDIRSNKKEHTLIFYLNSRQQEITKEHISVGTLTQNLVHPREVFEPAIRHNAAQIIVAHNHPSGDCEPSEEDIIVTERLVHAGMILGIDVIDHVIVTQKYFVSLRERGMIPSPSYV
ncbi:DNA repair protein RadC [Patescibacteria group bacterium]|nr:DNA repair protein RadC [Patescibacteria group bacterium]MBU1721270.1 DNA repair protein RadC [Patescibacteria group bacterium]MBU1901022.1 DNA repair protein RadC [Patescibacteria group bacterium]